MVASMRTIVAVNLVLCVQFEGQMRRRMIRDFHSTTSDKNCESKGILRYKSTTVNKR